MVAPQTSVVGKISAQEKKETGDQFGGIFSKKMSQETRNFKSMKMVNDKKPEKWHSVAKKNIARSFTKNNADKNIHSGLYSAKVTNKVDISKKNSRTFRSDKKKKKNHPFSMMDKADKDCLLANQLWKKENEKMWKSFEQLREEFKEADKNLKEKKEIKKKSKNSLWKKLLCFKRKEDSEEVNTNIGEEIAFKIIEKHEKYFLRVQQDIMS